MDKLWHICIMEYYTGRGRHKVLLHATAQMNLISNVGQEKRHTEIHSYCIILLT